MEEPLGKADTHVHCNYSGYNNLGIMKFPESVIDPEVQVDDARRRGISVLAITDHNETAGARRAQTYAKRFGDIDVIVGDEVMTDSGEVIGLWLTETPKSFMSPEETVDVIHEQGGIAIAPHPFSVHVDGLQERIFDLPIEGFEVMNGGHPDSYSNWFAQRVMDAHPGRWAALSGSDAHSLYTAGYNWTEFRGSTEEEFRRAILRRETIPVGCPAPPLDQVKWSMEVVAGGQRLMRKALKRELEPVPDSRLVEKILRNSDLKNASGILFGCVYRIPFVPMLATLLSVSYLNRHARKARERADERFAEIERIIAEKGCGVADGDPGTPAAPGMSDDGRARDRIPGGRIRSAVPSGRGDGRRRRGRGPRLPRILQMLHVPSGQGDLEVRARIAPVRRDPGRDNRRGRGPAGVHLQRGGPRGRGEGDREGPSLRGARDRDIQGDRLEIRPRAISFRRTRRRTSSGGGRSGWSSSCIRPPRPI